jgi:NitT/TauT family transport system substrate-binding protein
LADAVFEVAALLAPSRNRVSFCVTIADFQEEGQDGRRQDTDSGFAPSCFLQPADRAIPAGFLREEGLEAAYAALHKGRRAHEMIRKGEIDVAQAAVSTNWSAMEKGETGLPVHFAQINRRDGFFPIGRSSGPPFAWRHLEGSAILADHGAQPLAMLRFAAGYNGAAWDRVRLLNAGTPEEMAAAFRSGHGDYVHLQGPAAQQLEEGGAGRIAVSIGASMPPVAFSSLMASQVFLQTGRARAFLRAYRKAREWVQRWPAAEVAGAEASCFPGISQGALASAVAGYQAWAAGRGTLPSGGRTTNRRSRCLCRPAPSPAGIPMRRLSRWRAAAEYFVNGPPVDVEGSQADVVPKPASGDHAQERAWPPRSEACLPAARFAPAGSFCAAGKFLGNRGNRENGQPR